MLFTDIHVIRRKKAAELSLSQHVATKWHKTLEQIATSVLESAYKSIWIGNFHVTFGRARKLL